MKEINQKKLLEQIETMEATFLVMIKQLNEMKKQLTYIPPMVTKKAIAESARKMRLQRTLANKERARMKYYAITNT